ncbi:hypothetical protein EV126DRAFT_410748 [Verticillium dahliae]|nr:hypothetical protein EV126DRAFT_410748 [Verticillium dahliae]
MNWWLMFFFCQLKIARLPDVQPTCPEKTSIGCPPDVEILLMRDLETEPPTQGRMRVNGERPPLRSVAQRGRGSQQV